MSHEKRLSPRLPPFLTPCRLHFPGRALTGYLSDLSTRGARVFLEHELPPVGARLEIEVRFRREPRPTRLSCDVKWARGASGGRQCVGVRFVELGASERAQIERIIEEFQKQAARVG